MTILTRYLISQVSRSMLLGVAAMTAIFLLGNVMREIIGILSNNQAPLHAALQAIGLLVPFVLVYTLPVGFLTATLLVFGRLSSENEITAARATGISVSKIAAPVFAFAAIFSVFSAYVSMELGPKARYAYKKLIYSVGAQSLTQLIPEGRWIRQPGKFVLYVGKVDGTELQDIKLYEVSEDAEGNRVKGMYIQAQSARILQENQDGAAKSLTIEFSEPEVTQGAAIMKGAPGSTMKYELPLTGGRRRQLKSPERDEMGFVALRRFQAEAKEIGMAPEEQSAIRVHIHHRLAFACSSLAFALIGVPLGVRSNRKESSAGILMAVGLMLVYYAFFVLAKSWDEHPERWPHLLVWIPNILFACLGIHLLRRIDRPRA